MSRFFLAALLILSAAGVRAQNFQMRIGGGVATHYNNATPIGSFKAGLGVEFELSQSLTDGRITISASISATMTARRLWIKMAIR